MKVINIDVPQSLLTADMFNGEEATVYVVKRDYKINGPILLPKGSELRVEGGSISIGKSENNNTPSGIYLLTSDQEKIRLKSAEDIKKEQLGEVYWNLCVTSRSDFSEDENSLKYTPTLTKFLDSGCVISNRTENHFEMTLNCECRIMLPKDTKRATLKITSDKVHPIQIDGKCNFQIHAENCWLERIFACEEGMSMNNRLWNNIDYNRFYDCRITAGEVPDIVKKDFKKFPSEKYSGNYISIGVGVALREEDPDGTEYSEALNWMILRDCEIDNIGLAGYVYAMNSTFIYGDNVNNNYEMIHCTDHSRIINCIFDGYRSKEEGHELKGDIVDTYNGHNIIISGCTFKDFKSPLKIEDKHVPGYHMITIKSHYYPSNPPTERTDLSNFRGPQCGVVVRNCVFDLPEFTGNGIEMWNSAKEFSIEYITLNRQFTLIENNHINMPIAHCFIYNMAFADYVRILNNHACLNRSLVLCQKRCPPTYKDQPTEKRIRNHGSHFVISGNVLKFDEKAFAVTHNSTIDGENKTSSNSKDKEQYILNGPHINHLTLTNNISQNHLWNFVHEEDDYSPQGTIRVMGNITIDGALFRGRSKAEEWNLRNVFYSKNISENKPCDFGNENLAQNPVHQLLFQGRQFFNTDTNELMIYSHSEWKRIKFMSAKK